MLPKLVAFSFTFRVRQQLVGSERTAGGAEEGSDETEAEEAAAVTKPKVVSRNARAHTPRLGFSILPKLNDDDVRQSETAKKKKNAADKPDINLKYKVEVRTKLRMLRNERAKCDKFAIMAKRTKKFEPEEKEARTGWSVTKTGIKRPPFPFTTKRNEPEN